MLKEKTIYIPPMDNDHARFLAAAFRASGLKAEALSPSDEHTREIRDRYTTGDECHPFQILTGDVMKLLEGVEVDPAKTVFLIPSSDGSCRFSRFVPDLQEILERSGYGQVEILSPNLSDAQEWLDLLGVSGIHTAWRALIAAGVLRKLQLFYRPYAILKGDVDKVYEKSLRELCSVIESTPVAVSEQFEVIRSTLLCIGDRFRTIPLKPERSAPMIGIVGEGFCRFNPLLNNDLIRQIEDRGGQVRLTGLMAEIRGCVRVIPDMIEMLNRDEAAFHELFQGDLADWSEPDSDAIMEFAAPYVPVAGGFTEVALRLGRIVHMATQGVDGIIDASPFPCLHVSACASFYAKLSCDLDGLPIQNLYFNGAPRDWSAQLDEYLGQARTYRERKIEGKNQP
jgi:predicted nucleotide-binding protein (sugar kinase/HSP70/actin superfamily)